MLPFEKWIVRKVSVFHERNMTCAFEKRISENVALLHIPYEISTNFLYYPALFVSHCCLAEKAVLFIPTVIERMESSLRDKQILTC